jgi:hypothetical protein
VGEEGVMRFQEVMAEVVVLVHPETPRPALPRTHQYDTKTLHYSIFCDRGHGKY